MFISQMAYKGKHDYNNREQLKKQLEILERKHKENPSMRWQQILRAILLY